MTETGEAARHVLYDVADGVARITLNRPERRNAFVGRMRDDLHDALARAEEDAAARVVVVTGAGAGFCSGADVDVMSDLLARGDDETFAGLVEAGMRAVRRLHSLSKPTVAAVNGAAAGAGASLALACDVRIAAAGASIGVTFNRIGLHPDWGATYFLPRLVGPGRAAELVFSGRMVESWEAERLGIFERVVPDAEFEGAVAEYAAALATRAPLAIRAAKRSLAASLESDLETVLRAECEAQLACFRSADVREGIAAFREKRPAVFTGR